MGKKAMFCLLLDNLSDDEHRRLCETGFAPAKAQVSWGELLSQVLGRALDMSESESIYCRFYLQHDETIAVMNLLEPDGPPDQAVKPVHPLQEMAAFRPRPDRTTEDDSDA